MIHIFSHHITSYLIYQPLIQPLTTSIPTSFHPLGRPPSTQSLHMSLDSSLPHRTNTPTTNTPLSIDTNIGRGPSPGPRAECNKTKAIESPPSSPLRPKSPPKVNLALCATFCSPFFRLSFLLLFPLPSSPAPPPHINRIICSLNDILFHLFSMLFWCTLIMQGPRACPSS